MAGELRAHGAERGSPRGRLAEPLGLAHLRAHRHCPLDRRRHPARPRRAMNTKAALAARRLRALAMLAALLACPALARAHDAPFSFVDLHVTRGGVEGRVMAH